MYYTVVSAKHVRDHIIHLKFEDGTEGDVDLSSELWGEMFEPFKDPAYFRTFDVAEYGTIAWPNGADIAPEFLYERVRVAV